MAIYLAAYSALPYLESQPTLIEPARVDTLADAECSLHALESRETELRRLRCGMSPAHILIADKSKHVASD